MVTLRSRLLCSVIFHNVIVFQCYFLYFKTPLARYTEVIATLNNLFYMNISIWRTLIEIDNVLRKNSVFF